MNTQSHSKSLVRPIDEMVDDRNAKNLSMSSVLVKKRKNLLVLTIWTWMIAVLLPVLFFFAYRNDLAGMDWLADLLLGMVFLGWIVTGYYYRDLDRSTGKIDMINKLNTLPASNRSPYRA